MNRHGNKPFWGDICKDCAEGVFKATWPEGQVSTVHVDECGWCRDNKEVCHTRNWDFPDGTEWHDLK